MRSWVASSMTRTLPGALCALLAAVCALAMAAAPAGAQEPTKAPASQEKHVVRRGDTLWDIARQYLNDPFQWPKIYEANKDRIKDPHWIYPNQRLFIPGVGWVTTKAAPTEEVAENVAVADGPLDPTGKPRTRFYNRDAPGEGINLLDPAVLASVTRGDYYSAPWLGDPAALPAVGQVIRGVDARPGADQLAQLFLVQEQVYIKYLGSTRPAAGDKLLLVRRADDLGTWGTILEPVGIAAVDSLAKDVMVARVTQEFGPVLEGVLALPLPAFPEQTGETQPVSGGAEGEIVAFLREQPIHTTADIAFVSLGYADGLRTGDELEVLLPERADEKHPGVELPPTEVGRVRVLRVEQRTASGQVTKLSQARIRPGMRVKVVRKAP